MDILVKVGQLILSLSILVLLHEFGHFFFAKLFKTKVEKFYLFFDPWFSLFKIKKGETEYGIGWLPLGGYVKIAGMIDESMDKAQLEKPAEEWEFRAKPAWQRLLIMLGGVLVNFLLAIAIYIGVLFTWGDTYLPTEKAKYGIEANKTLQDVGFQNGDKIISIGAIQVNEFHKILPELILNGPTRVKVERNGKEQEVLVQQQDIASIIEKKGFMLPRVPFFVGGFSEESLGKAAGIQIGDQLVGINGKELLFFDQYPTTLDTMTNKKIVINLLRDGAKMEIAVQLDDKARLGIARQFDQAKFFDLSVKKYTFAQAIPAGIDRGVEQIDSYLKQLKLIFNSETGAYKQVGGLGTIANIFPSVWVWQDFWNLTALLSIMLAVLNILPIPALDGGHVMFTLYEIIARRKPNEKFLEYAQYVGMILLLALLVYANGMDVIRAFN